MRDIPVSHVGMLAAIAAAKTVNVFAAPISADRRRELQRFAEVGNREVQQVVTANQHRDAALAGGGSREVARRARQIAAGKLKVTP